MSEKVTGYLLLVVGLVIMVASVINMFLVFTNKAKPFSVFNLSSSDSSTLNINDIIGQIQKNNPNAANQTISAPKLDILPPEVLNKTLNLSTHFFLISFILGFGYKLANLGTQLIRPINIKLNSHSEPPPPPNQTVQPIQPT